MRKRVPASKGFLVYLATVVEMDRKRSCSSPSPPSSLSSPLEMDPRPTGVPSRLWASCENQLTNRDLAALWPEKTPGNASCLAGLDQPPTWAGPLRGTQPDEKASVRPALGAAGVARAVPPRCGQCSKHTTFVPSESVYQHPTLFYKAC